MATLRNAFKYRIADRQSIETGLFLHLYCPVLLNQLSPDDFAVPKLLVFRGSPGSGKSSFLRLFQTDSLTTLFSRRTQPGYDVIAEVLSERGVFSDTGIRYIGLYLQCDSNLRDINNADVGPGNLKLFNTLVDVRVTLAYVRGLRVLRDARILGTALEDAVCEPLPREETPPPLFSERRTIQGLEEECTRVEESFASLLNSFPGDVLPSDITPHSRTFSLSYLARLLVRNRSWPVPVLLLDDLQDLYPEQREHARRELIRRSSLPRWVAVRKHVYGLEELLPLEGTKDGREVREIDLDFVPAKDFRRFLDNVTLRRLRLTDVLRQYDTQDFRLSLKELPETIPADPVRESLSERLGRLGNTDGVEAEPPPIPVDDVPVDWLEKVELQLILAERRRRRAQPYILRELEPLERPDSKTEEAARLFASKRYDLPYYFGFDVLTGAANGNVEQYLEIAGQYADKMIFRAELDRRPDLTAREQDKLLRGSAKRYVDRIEQGFRRGYAIHQFVENLGRFCQAVTARPNAPIAPGVTGFGLEPSQLRDTRDLEASEGVSLFREALASAVAGNVLSARRTKQGKVGSENIVFYLNRILCIHFGLPLNYGGWQRLPLRLLIRMMFEPVPESNWRRKWEMRGFDLEEGK